MIIKTNYPISSEISTDYEILLNGEPAKAVFTRVSALKFNRPWPGKQRPVEQTELASYISFATDEDVEITVTPKKDFKNAVVRPISAEIKPIISGKTIQFTCKTNGKYTLELDGPHNALHIFADSLTNYDIPENAMYFGAGVHDIGNVELNDNTTVYIDRDAVVYGSFYAVGAKNIAILGNGVLDGSHYERETKNFLLAYDYSRVSENSWETKQMAEIFKDNEELFGKKEDYIKGSGTFIFKSKEQFNKILDKMVPVKTGLSFYACKNIEINGIIIRNTAGLSCTQAGCEQIHYNNVKLVGLWRYNSDGIDFYNCKNCTVKNSFIRSYDDCVCVKGQIGWDTENSSDILIENCVLWNDWGNTLDIGIDTVAPEICNITFKNCDCIHNSHKVIDVGNEDRANIHDILFEDIRVEYSSYDVMPKLQNSDDEEFFPEHCHSCLIYSFINCGVWSNDILFGKIHNVTFKDIKILSDEDFTPEIKFLGKDSEHNISNITLENITFNNKKLAQKDIDFNANVFADYEFKN